MEKRDGLSKGLAIAGTVLVWIPLLAPIFFSVIRFIEIQDFQFDYLMPAELFPSALVGSILLLWAALRTHLRRGLIGWGLGIAVGTVVGGQVIAEVTGLASGETEPTGWPVVLVMGAIGIFTLSLAVIGIGGILLIRDLFKSAP